MRSAVIYRFYPTRQTLNEQKVAIMNNRKSIRLKGYNYTASGAYFITICTKNHVHVFGEIVDGKMGLNGNGETVRAEWIKTSVMRSNIEIDEFVIMPNHLHGIIVINYECSISHRPVVRERFGNPTPNSIPTIIRGFKSAVTSRLNKKNKRPGFILWQRNYWEHIIRNEQSMNQLREYINTNPLRWRDDCFHGESQPSFK